MGIKVLVTGGAGYIGSVLVPMLKDSGYDVTVVDNLMYRQIPQYPVINKEVEDLPREFYKDFDVIIPLAALVGMPICKRRPAKAVVVNLKAIERMIKYLQPEQKIIYPCTNSGYGQGICTEKSPLKPVSLYGRTKVDAEGLVKRRDNHITLRLATVFGVSPTMRVDLLVNDFVYRAHKGVGLELYEPHFIRNYVHIRDVAGAFLYCIKHWEEMKNDTYNFGLSNANLSKLELCEEILKFYPDFKVIVGIGKDPDQRDYTVINDKIESKGLKARISVEQGIRELKEYYAKNYS